MQVVILAAGKSTRTFPLTVNKPKPLLKIANKAIIDYTLESVSDFASEIIIVVGHAKDQIINHCKDSFQGIPITYHEQVEQNGTGGALISVKDQLKDKFLVLNADDIISKNDIKKCITHDFALLVQEVEDLQRFGEVVIEGANATGIIEKPEKKHGYANLGVYVFSPEIFEYELEKSPRGEYEITDYINNLNEKVVVEHASDTWLPISYPWNLLDAQEVLFDNIQKDIAGTVEEGATVKGDVVIGEGTIVKSGAYIEGPVMIGKNCTIGPNCYIRSCSSIGDKSKIGNAVEIKNTIIGDNSAVGHLSYIGDSIIGDHVNVAAGCITANLRHDQAHIKSNIKEQLVDTGRRKLGVVLGDDVHLGINTSMYPGRKIWPGCSTEPGYIVKKDIKS